jgi:ABC-2 type transport system permease protein
MTRAQGIQGYTSQIVLRALQRSSAKGLGHSPPARIGFETRFLYNPSLRSAVYLVPGVMSVITCLITILLTSMSLAREKELGTFETIIAAPVQAHEVILGKTLPYVVLGMANMPLILAIAILVFDVPMRGSFLALSLASLVFVFATVAIGTLISTITRTQQQAMMGGFLYLLPSILISGLMSPVSSMPLPLQWISYMNPVTYYMELLRNIMLKGGNPDLILRNSLIMGVLALLLALLSIKRFKTTLS